MKSNYILHVTAVLFLIVSTGRSQCLDQTVGPVSSSIICSGSGTISLASSQAGVNYYVRNDATSLTVGAPVAGTGSTLLLGTGHMTTSTIYNIYAKKATGALAFDGVDDYVSISSPLNSNGNFTWEGWFKTNSDGTIFSKSDPSGTWSSGSKSLFLRNGKLTFEVFGVGYVETYPVYNDNNWHHASVTAEMSYTIGANDRVRLYIDGAFQAEKNDWDINANSETGLINKIGYTNSNFPVTSFFHGVIDEIKIWSTARTATDVASDMSSCLTGIETNLVAYYQFNDGSGTTLLDAAGGDNNGTLNNMAAASWVYGRDECGSCSLQLTQKPVFIITALSDQTLTAASLTLCSNISTSINTSGSELGVNYYLRDNSTYSVLSGPYAGTGGSLGLSTGIVANTTTYNVIANRLSGALSFDGVDDYVIVNETSVLENLGTGAFTMESWIFPTNVTGKRSIISKEGDYNLYINNGALVAEVFPGGGLGGALNQATSNTTLTPNKWSHVVAEWSGTTFSLYINTVPSTYAVGNLSSSQTSKLCFGGSKIFNQPFEGRIDELRMWTGVRTVSQLTANVGSCFTGTEPGLIGYYQFEDGKGSSVLTDKLMNNNGTLSNMDNINAWKGGVENCGCSLMLSQRPAVTANQAPTVAVNSGSVCSGKSFTITPSGSATSYTITGGNFTVTPSGTTSYSVTGTNTSGCISNTAVATITVNVTPTISATSFSICSGNQAIITPTGAANYSITGNAFTVTPASTTSYSITGTSTVGCIASNTAVATVSVGITPTVSVNSGSLCSGQSFTIQPSGANNYTVSGGNFTVTPSNSISYSVTGTSTNGCLATNTAVASITVNVTPTLSVNSATVCSGNSVVITPTGAASYSITGNSFTVTPSGTTSYSVMGTSTAGCMASNTAVATVSISSTPTVYVNSGSICSGGSFTLQPTGAGTYTITGGIYTVTPSSTTSYSITGAYGSCMATNTAVATVTVNTTPTISVSNYAICSGNSVVITPTGAANYSITGNTYTVSPATTTSYSITGTSTAACMANMAVVTVTVNTTPTVSVNSGAICAGSSFTLLPSGANTYTVSGNTLTVSPSSNASYTVTGTSTAGCISSNAAVASVTVNTLPTIAVSNAVICPGNSYTLMPSGAGSYTYSGGSAVVTPNITSSYTITGSSLQGCAATNTAVATVSVVNTLTVSITGNTTICSGQSTTLTVNGAATYTWNNAVQTTTIALSPLSTTVYSVTGSSGTCSNTAMVTLSVIANPTVNVNSGTICSGGVFTIIPSGAVSYTISGGSTTVSPASTSIYSVSGSSGPGCVSINTAVSVVNVNQRPVISAQSSRSVICTGETVVLSAQGGTNYAWSDAQTGASVTVGPTLTITYTVTGISSAGCTNTATVMQRVDACTAISSNSATQLIFGIYPNPNNGQFTVESVENAEIVVMNSLGQIVYQETSKGTGAAISISNFANGVYFVKATSGSSHQVMRIIKE